ncbi:hypothetical protein CDL12_04373 [Handroanthus impetiginosus]|uniref:Donson n=1 Tax=Handroanthus impetiginosus TaxID=429701 RepID=A0A2G9HZG8_9LAMI|nr:hypothetical protein CDL12_04373 [Handroanthus impetiginosus]
MTKVATAGHLPVSNALHFSDVTAGGGGGSKIPTTTLKRKTPSELRGELLKRKNTMELVDECASVTGLMRNADGAVSGPNKSDSSKASRFTRMDEHYPVTKISRLLSRVENPKKTVPSNSVGTLKNSSLSVDLNAKHQVKNSCLNDTDAPEGGSTSSNQTNNSTEKYANNTFKSVLELSLGGEKLNGSSSVDMGKALKGLVSCRPHAASALLAGSVNRAVNIAQSFCSEFQIPDYKIPLDLTLKTNMRLLSSTSVDWFHRLTNCAPLNAMDLFSHVDCQTQSITCSLEPTSTSQTKHLGTFHSWVYPQSTLPRAAISALTSLPGGQVDFLSKRQQAWEDSFRSLYYMLRKKVCKIFYVCSGQFVVMFTASDGSNKTKDSCYAYVSQSTRNLRLFLKEHDVSFSMPLSYSEVEEVTVEDLVELSEIAKHNLGQAQAVDSMSGVDNTPQSLLMFTGNKNVHALYDLLLNYRSLFTSLAGDDVPVLYSPVPFQNAALSAPEVRCKQVRRVNSISSQLKECNMDSVSRSSSAGICYSVEISDAYIPPWVICGICSAIRSNGGDFQARTITEDGISYSKCLVTESTSIGLNVGLEPSQLTKADEPLQQSGHCFGISNTTLSLRRRSAFLKGLKYGGGSYTAFLSPVE